MSSISESSDHEMEERNVRFLASRCRSVVGEGDVENIAIDVKNEFVGQDWWQAYCHWYQSSLQYKEEVKKSMVNYDAWFEIELQLGNVNRCRRLYRKYLEWATANCYWNGQELRFVCQRPYVYKQRRKVLN